MSAKNAKKKPLGKTRKVLDTISVYKFFLKLGKEIETS